MGKLTPSLRVALEDCHASTARGWPYWWKPRSMEKLAELGLVERDDRPCRGWGSNEHRYSYRLTDAGRAALKEAVG